MPLASWESLTAPIALAVILVGCLVLLIWNLLRSVDATKAQKQAYDQAVESWRESHELNTELIRLAREQAHLQQEGNKLMGELIDALRSFKQSVKDN